MRIIGFVVYNIVKEEKKYRNWFWGKEMEFYESRANHILRKMIWWGLAGGSGIDLLTGDFAV